MAAVWIALMALPIAQDDYVPFIARATNLLAAMQDTSPYSDVVAVLRPAVAFDTVYAGPPQHGAYYTMYEEEPLRLVLEISNWAKQSRLVLMPSRTATASVAVDVTRNGEPVNLPIAFAGDVYQRGPGADYQIQWPERIDLPPRQTLTVEADVPPLKAGLYEFLLRTAITDEDRRPLRPQGAVLPIEVRVASGGERTEALRRRALFAYLDGDFPEAERRVARLLTASPNNFSAFVIRGNIARAEGRTREAARNYDRAIAILESGSDVEYLKWSSPAKARELVDTLRFQRPVAK